jgi:hypothetical protein
MHDIRLLAIALTDAVVREDSDAIHVIHTQIERYDLGMPVMAATVGLLASALVNAHGVAGASEHLDYARADLLRQDAPC